MKTLPCPHCKKPVPYALFASTGGKALAKMKSRKYYQDMQKKGVKARLARKISTHGLQ